ncbi:MAG: hypothetical protein ACE5RP_00165 [Nitrosopumilus sp.]
MIEWFGGFILSMLFAIMLFSFAQSKKKVLNTLFWIISLLPTALFILAVISLINAFGTSKSIFFIGILFTIIVLERIMWALALNESAGEDKVIWFLIIYYVPLFGWLIYRITKLG